MKIEKCPFCGGEVKIEMLYSENSRNVKIYSAVLCPKCYGWFFKELSKEKTVAAWNRRDGKDTNVTTNADRIRSMSDKELAEYIFDLGNGSEYCYGHCAYQDDCWTRGLNHDTCIKGVIDWLQQPVKEEIK